eukprot:Nk52_evm1s1620 gene=Nk52_evmTU1s1620
MTHQIYFGPPRDQKKVVPSLNDILKKTTCGELVWHKRTLKYATKYTTLSDALDIMHRENVITLPVVEELPNHELKILGLISMFEIMYFTAFGHVAREGQSLKKELQTFSREWLSNMHVKVLLPLSQEASFAPQVVAASDSLLDALEFLVDGYHKVVVRIPKDLVNGIPHNEYRIMSQYDVIRHISSHIDHHKELEGITCLDLSNFMGSKVTIFKPKLISASRSDTVCDVMKTMVIHDIRAVPITNPETGEYECTFSCSDLRKLNKHNLAKLLSGTVHELLEHFSVHYYPVKPPCVCQGSESLFIAINRCNKLHCHRIWLVNEKGIPTATLSLTDLLRAVQKLAV